MIRRLVAAASAWSLLLALGSGCASLSFRVIDPSTQRPVPQVKVEHLDTHGNLMDFLMMLPPEHSVLATAHTDANGRVKFDHVTLGSVFSFAEGRCHAYFRDNYWRIESDTYVDNAWKIGDDLYVPIDPRTSFVGKTE